MCVSGRGGVILESDGELANENGAANDTDGQCQCDVCEAFLMNYKTTELYEAAEKERSLIWHSKEVPFSDIAEEAEFGCALCQVLCEALDIAVEQAGQHLETIEGAYLLRRWGSLKNDPDDAVFTVQEPFPDYAADDAQDRSGFRFTVDFRLIWGHVPRVTKALYPQYIERIPDQALSQTFLDAIEVTRKLGFRYLWVDALCIVQDDTEDWLREAAQMSSIYEGASLTIAATSSKDGQGGCFYDWPTPDTALQSTPLACGRLYVRMFIEHTLDDALHYEEGTLQDLNKIDKLPLVRRKWAFQERTLSRRVVFYTEDELWWECNSQYACECSGIIPPLDPFEPRNWTKLAFVEMSLGHSPLSGGLYYTPASLWSRLMEEYSRKFLTYDTDNRPACSAIAKVFHASAGADLGSYCAGLWEHSLPMTLCWWRDPGPFGKRGSYCAPTWSWASIQAPVLWPLMSIYGGGVDARVLDVDCRAEGSDPFGRVSSGFLKLDARGLPARLARGDRLYGGVWLEGWEQGEELMGSIDTEDEIEGLTGQSVWLVCIRENNPDYEEEYGCYLLLRPLSSNEGFKRIGMFHDDNGLQPFIADLKAADRRIFHII
ncbi:hypothetical protein LTR85_004709 [Meristemomyces frigidus]|nr:hypothetical protein LTR85_004709 [Meristemomyces frigidus]